MTTLPPKQEDVRYAAVRQYSLAQILAVWAAAAIPMAVLAWLVAPLLGALLGGGVVAFAQALLLCITAVGGRVWLWVIPFVLLFGIWEFYGYNPSGPANRDLTIFVNSAIGQEFFSGAWGWFGVIVVQLVFVSFLGEDLLFRGLLLPRMRGVFGRGDFVANGVLYGFYHLHQPWSIPASVVANIFFSGYPTRRWQSVWMSVIVHSAQSVFIFFVILALVLG